MMTTRTSADQRKKILPNSVFYPGTLLSTALPSGHIESSPRLVTAGKSFTIGELTVLGKELHTFVVEIEIDESLAGVWPRRSAAQNRKVAVAEHSFHANKE